MSQILFSMLYDTPIYNEVAGRILRIRRILLNGNQLENIRELSSQISFAPIDYPICRLDDQAWGQHASWAREEGIFLAISVISGNAVN